MKTTARKTLSFTLIELLIVIGLLGALTALILPSLTAVREDAIGDVCDYNQAGTVRVLKEFKQLYNHYPTGMHTGLQTSATGAFAMVGLPDAQKDHMGEPGAETPVACPSTMVLTENLAKSLADAGIDTVCYDAGYDPQELSTTEGETTTYLYVVSATGWKDDGGNDMTFDGLKIADWETGTATPAWDRENGAGKVVVLWITPTTDWTPDFDTVNNDWSKGSVRMSLDLPGKCPVPVEDIDGGDPDFAYYMAYFKVYDNGAPARLIGTTCPECGVLNP